VWFERRKEEEGGEKKREQKNCPPYFALGSSSPRPLTIKNPTASKDDPTKAGHVTKAIVFVSHAWGHEFLDVVAALEAYDATRRAPTVFWFDIFSNNQHKTAVRDFTWWQTVFRDNIGKLKRTLLVLAWNDPKPLSRAWCLWEMVSTVNTSSNFQVLMSPKNHASFAAALVGDFDSIVFKTCNVDLSKAQAFNPSDRDNIFKAVKETAGMDEVNKQVIGIMREWMAKSGREALKGLPEKGEPASVLRAQVAHLFQDQGKFGDAEALLRIVLGERRSARGDTDPDTLTVTPRVLCPRDLCSLCLLIIHVSFHFLLVTLDSKEQTL